MNQTVRSLWGVVVFVSFVFLFYSNISKGETLQFAKQQQRLVDSTIPNLMSCVPDSLSELRQLKAELLTEEFSLRHENIQNQENMFTLVRVLLLIIVIGSTILVYIKAKSSQTEISRLAILALIIILISVYWYDSFILDAQKRINDRVDTIPYILNQIPTMGGNELRALPIFEELTWPVGLWAKLELFIKKPNFAQVISYGPIIVVILLLIYRRQTLKKK
jgi:FtsH-binding integral membrane protein